MSERWLLMEQVKDIKVFDYFETLKYIQKLKEEYPFLCLESIGKSVLGRDIFSLRIGRAKEYVLFAAAFHGSEYITNALMLTFCHELCLAIANDDNIEGLNVRRAMYGRGLIIVPLINPDGCEISIHGKSGCLGNFPFINRISNGDLVHFNANARGVDINHNFNAFWEPLRELERKNQIYGPAKTRFGGYFPESEPETIALCNLCRKTNIRHAVAFHSQGEVIYAPEGDNPPKRSEKMAEIMAASSGYIIDKPEGLAVGGGFKDWFVKEFNRPAFTVEVGLGENPLPQSDYFTIYRRIREMLMLTAIM